MSLSQLPFTELLRAFRSSEPTPGGGSASALAGAVGASLLAMVAGLPKPRVETDEQAQRLAAAGTRAGAVSERLTTLMDRDSEAYDLVVAAFRLPKSYGRGEARACGASSGRAARGDRGAARGHARLHRGDTARQGCGGVRQSQRLERHPGGGGAARAGVRGAKLNVDVNLASVTDDGFAGTVRREAEQLIVAAGQRTASAAAQLTKG